MKKRTMNVRKLLNSDEKRERFLQRCVYVGQGQANPWNGTSRPHIVEYRTESHIKRYRIYSPDDIGSILFRRKRIGIKQKGVEVQVKRESEKQLVLMAAFPHYLGD